MSTSAEPPLRLAEITRRAIQVLARELGPADSARFVGQFSGGSGDYTAERDALFADLSLGQLAPDIRGAVAPDPTPPETPNSGPPGAGASGR